MVGCTALDPGGTIRAMRVVLVKEDIQGFLRQFHSLRDWAHFIQASFGIMFQNRSGLAFLLVKSLIHERTSCFVQGTKHKTFAIASLPLSGISVFFRFCLTVPAKVENCCRHAEVQICLFSSREHDSRANFHRPGRNTIEQSYIRYHINASIILLCLHFQPQ